MYTKETLELINKNLDKWDNPKVVKDCFGFIDLTTLNTTDTKSKVEELTGKVNDFKTIYRDFPDVAAICVYPNFAAVVKEKLKAENVKIAAVAGVFPNSQSFTQVKVLESKLAAESGADEIDIVLSLGKFLAGDKQGAAEEIKLIKESIGSAHLKVILESGSLNSKELIYEASILSLEAGADFIKTSTGKSEPAATPEAAVVMCEAIKDFYKKTGQKRGFKPAGGIVNKDDALRYYAIVDTILGNEWLVPELFRIGASRLANNLLSDIYKSTIKYF